MDEGSFFPPNTNSLVYDRPEDVEYVHKDFQWKPQMVYQSLKMVDRTLSLVRPILIDKRIQVVVNHTGVVQPIIYRSHVNQLK